MENIMGELFDTLRKLFVGHAEGIIDDRNYEMLMKDFQAEQEELEQKLSALIPNCSLSSLERLSESV